MTIYRRVINDPSARHRLQNGERGLAPGTAEARTSAQGQRSDHKVTMGSPRTGIGRCLGTFGELLQGALPIESREFLVTLPITEGSTAEFTAVHESKGVRVSPPHKEKSRRLAEELMRLCNLEVGGELHIESEL